MVLDYHRSGFLVFRRRSDWLLSTIPMPTFRPILKKKKEKEKKHQHHPRSELQSVPAVRLAQSILTSRLVLLPHPYHFQLNGSAYTTSSQLVCMCFHWELCADIHDQHHPILRSAIQAVLTCRTRCVSCSGVCKGNSIASTIGTLCETSGWCSAVFDEYSMGCCFSVVRVVSLFVVPKV